MLLSVGNKLLITFLCDMLCDHKMLSYQMYLNILIIYTNKPKSIYVLLVITSDGLFEY